MKKVYELNSDLENYSSFIELYDNVNNTFFYNYFGWKEIDMKTYSPVVYQLYAGSNVKKNYNMDISTGSGLIILSERAITLLKPILEQTGKILSILTPSKRKIFFGFYPNKNVYDNSIINLEKSDWRQAEKGKIFSTIILNNNYPKDDYLFTLKENAMDCYVTDKFRELVEKHDLKGFDFSREIAIVD